MIRTLSSLTDQIKSQAKQIEILMQRNKEMQARYSDVVKEAQQFRKSFQINYDQLQKCREQLRKSLYDNSILRMQCNRLNEVGLQIENKSIQGYNKLKQEQESCIHELRRELGEKIQTIRVMEDKHLKDKQRSESLVLSNAQLVKIIELNLEKEKDFRSQIRNSQARIQGQQKDIGELEGKIRSLQGSCGGLEKEVLSLRVQLDKTNEELNKKQSHMDKDISASIALKQQIRAVKSSNSLLRRQLAATLSSEESFREEYLRIKIVLQSLPNGDYLVGNAS